MLDPTGYVAIAKSSADIIAMLFKAKKPLETNKNFFKSSVVPFNDHTKKIIGNYMYLIRNLIVTANVGNIYGDEEIIRQSIIKNIDNITKAMNEFYKSRVDMYQARKEIEDIAKRYRDDDRRKRFTQYFGCVAEVFEHGIPCSRNDTFESRYIIFLSEEILTVDEAKTILLDDNYGLHLPVASRQLATKIEQGAKKIATEYASLVVAFE